MAGLLLALVLRPAAAALIGRVVEVRVAEGAANRGSQWKTKSVAGVLVVVQLQPAAAVLIGRAVEVLFFLGGCKQGKPVRKQHPCLVCCWRWFCGHGKIHTPATDHTFKLTCCQWARD